MPSTFDLILKNGKCFIDGQLKTLDIGISGGIIKRIDKIFQNRLDFLSQNCLSPMDAKSHIIYCIIA